MGGIVRYPAVNDMAAFIDAPDPIYGSGHDGDATLDGTTTVLGMAPTSSVYTMTRDMYFDDLTINAGVRLMPAGYRIFVKNVLTLNTNSIIGFVTGFATAGSIAQGGAAATSVTHSMGGGGISSPAGTTYTATAPTAALGGTDWFNIPHQAVLGYSVTASGGPTFLRGGAGGTGQAGGGVVIMAARYIAGPTSGTASIQAPATLPAGGGVVIIISAEASLPASISTSVTGQNAGTVRFLTMV